MSDRPELESSVVASTPEPEPPPQSEPDPATDVEGEPAADRESAADDAEAPVGVAAGPEAGREQGSWIDDAVAAIDDVVAWFRANSASVCLALVLAGIAIFTIVFGTLAVRNHRNFGTWAYDGAIYDQAIWLVSAADS